MRNSTALLFLITILVSSASSAGFEISFLTGEEAQQTYDQGVRSNGTVTVQLAMPSTQGLIDFANQFIREHKGEIDKNAVFKIPVSAVVVDADTFKCGEIRRIWFGENNSLTSTATYMKKHQYDVDRKLVKGRWMDSQTALLMKPEYACIRKGGGELEQERR